VSGVVVSELLVDASITAKSPERIAAMREADPSKQRSANQIAQAIDGVSDRDAEHRTIWHRRNRAHDLPQLLLRKVASVDKGRSKVIQQAHVAKDRARRVVICSEKGGRSSPQPKQYLVLRRSR